MIKKNDNNKLLNILFQSKLIYGDSIKTANKEIYPFIYGIRHKFTIIDIKKVSLFLKRIFKLLKLVVQRNQNVLVIGNSKDILFLMNKQFVKKKKNLIYFNSEWINGFITNPIVNQNRNLKFKNLFLNPEKEIGLILILKSDLDEKFLIKELVSLKVPIISIINTTNSIQNINYPVLAPSHNIKALYSLMFLFRKVF